MVLFPSEEIGTNNFINKGKFKLLDVIQSQQSNNDGHKSSLIM